MNNIILAKNEIKEALKHMTAQWLMQNNQLDDATKFIYNAKTIMEIISKCDGNLEKLNYALHRWYNFNCAKVHENIFVNAGAIKESDTYSKTKDFFLLEKHFDLKTTVFPKALKGQTGYDLTTRNGKNNLINWLYENQSKQGRFHLENRLFIVCKDLASKSNFDAIEKEVNEFVNLSRQHGFNTITIEKQNQNKEVNTDIIWIPN